MPTASPNADVGPLLREWRERRRLTQLELALDAGTSARHLSFVETGRSKPGREVLLRVAEQLEMPFRERNQLLLAAGYAPAFPERSLEEPELEPVREALDRVLTAQEPYPAMAMDRSWNVVAANSAFRAFGEWVDPELLEPPVNALRMGLHPRGLAPLVLNLGEVRAYFLERLQRQVAITADDDLAELLELVASYPAPEHEQLPVVEAAAREILTPLRMRTPDGDELSFVGTVATFGFAGEVTTSELSIESLFPADAATAETLESMASDRRNVDSQTPPNRGGR
ncbi:MAG TPA: helix-turn-helix domain-containing protein [Solirubrobacterales bacterium]